VGRRARGSPGRHLPSHAFVVCLENHDQVGNARKASGLEHLVTPGNFARRPAALSCPYAPLIFMGQEWAAGSPFLFFTTRRGTGVQIPRPRREFLLPDVAESRGARSEAPRPLAVPLRWENGMSPRTRTFALYRAGLHEAAVAPRPGGRPRALEVHVAGEFFASDTSGARRPAAAGDFAARVLPASFSAGTCAAGGNKWRIELHSEAAEFGGAGRPPPTGRRNPGAVTLWLAADRKEAQHAVSEAPWCHRHLPRAVARKVCVP